MADRFSSSFHHRMLSPPPFFPLLICLLTASPSSSAAPLLMPGPDLAPSDIEAFRDWLSSDIPVSPSVSSRLPLRLRHRHDPSLPRWLLSPLISQVVHDGLAGDAGFAVVDGLLGPSLAAAAHAEAVKLRDAKAFKSCTETCEPWSCGSEVDTTGRGDLMLWEHELPHEGKHPTSTTTNHPLRAAIKELEAIGVLLASLLPGLKLDSRSRAVLSYYSTGRGYPAHLDNPFPAISKDPRLITMLLYLNPGNWSIFDGGQLRLQRTTPLQRPQAAAAAAAAAATAAASPISSLGHEVDPILDRFVVFDARTMRHQVTQVHKERFALSMWLTRSELDSNNHGAAVGQELRPLPGVHGRCIACVPLAP